MNIYRFKMIDVNLLLKTKKYYKILIFCYKFKKKTNHICEQFLLKYSIFF